MDTHRLQKASAVPILWTQKKVIIILTVPVARTCNCIKSMTAPFSWTDIGAFRTVVYTSQEKGTTTMANLFTHEQQEILRANPYTLSVNDRQIKFTVPFKRYLLNEYAKPGVTLKQAFRNAGYDPDMLGPSRIRSIIFNIRKETASPEGLHETSRNSNKLAEEDFTKKRQEVAIRELQRELLKTQQELAFLKKILQLPPEDDGTP